MTAPPQGSHYSAVLDGTELRSTIRAISPPVDEEHEGLITDSEDEESQVDLSTDAEREQTQADVRARRLEQK